MTEHDLVIRRFDLAARISLLAAGLAAQGAMWVAGPSRAYLVGAMLLIGVSADASRRPLTRFVVSPVASRRRFTDRQVLAGRVVAGVVLVEICMGIVGALHVADGHAMGTPLGVLLLAVQIAYAGAVESRRDLKLGCAIVVVLLVQAGAFTTTSAVRLPMVASLVLLLIAVALLQRATALELVDSITLPGRAPLLRAFVGPVAGAAMLGVVAFLVVPNSLDLGIVTRVRMPSAHAAGNASGAPAGVGTRAEVDAGASTVDLRVRGALPTAPIFVVAATTPAYWQGAVFDNFDGTKWTSSSSAVSAAAASSNTSNASGGTIGVDAPRRTDVVDVVSITPLDVVLAPGTVTEYHGPGQVRTDTFGTTRLSLGPANGDRYQVESTTTDGASASQLRAAAGGGASVAADDMSPQWRQLPAGLPARVQTLAVSIAGAAPTRYDAVTAIDTYLQTHETYDLNSPRPAAGVNAVDDFLFVSGRGFCEQFASAAVVLLRSLGIPARLVTGFVQGDVSSFPGQRIMRGSDAHAWIQVWYPGVGWESSDPTAGSVATGAVPVPAAVIAPAATATPAAATASAPTPAAATASAPTPAAATASAPTPAQVSPSASATPSAPAVPAIAAAAPRKPAPSAKHAHASDLPGGRVRWLESLAALALLAGLVTRVSGRALRRRRRRRAAGTGRPTDGPVLSAYLRLDAALASRDQARGPGETVAEAEQRLQLAGAAIDRGGRLAASPDEIAGAVRCLEREVYGVDLPPRDQVMAAVAVLDRLRQRPGRPDRRQKPPRWLGRRRKHPDASR